MGNFLVSSSTFSVFSTFSAGAGRLVSLPVVYVRPGYPRGPRYPIGMSGMGTSSSSSSSDDSEVRLSSSSSPTSSSEGDSSSLSLDSSVQVEGSYSCFKGDDDRLLFLKPGSVGVNTGVLVPLRVTGVAGLEDRCGGVGGGSSTSVLGSTISSTIISCLFPCIFSGAEAEASRTLSSSSSASCVGVDGRLDFLCLGMLGNSSEGTEDTRLCACGRCGEGGEPGGEISESLTVLLSSSEL